MSTQDLPETPAAEPTNERCARKGGHRHRRGWRAFRFLAFVGLLVGVPLAVANAAGFGGGHCDKASVTSSEALRERMDRPTSWLLHKVDATDEQAARVDAVLDETAPALFALKDEQVALKDRLHTALAAPAVDAAEVERIRQDGLGLAEEASGVLVDALVDIANVLDAEQRAELLKLADRKHR